MLYLSKRECKHRIHAYMAIDEEALPERYRMMDITISMHDIAEDLGHFARQVGEEHLQYEMFQRYLYHKYVRSPDVVAAAGVTEKGLCQRFAALTLKRMEAAFNRRLDHIVQEELTLCSESLAPVRPRERATQERMTTHASSAWEVLDEQGDSRAKD